MYLDYTKCLSDTDFGAYRDGNLSLREKDAIDRHVTACKQCWSDFVAIHRVVLDEQEDESGTVPEYLVKKAIDIFPAEKSFFDVVLGLVKDTFKVVSCSPHLTMEMPVPAGVIRGNHDTCPGIVVLKKSFQDISVELDVEKLNKDLCNIRVSVKDVRESPMNSAFRVELLSQGRELASMPVEGGEALLEDIARARYVIRVTEKGNVLGEISLKIQ